MSARATIQQFDPTVQQVGVIFAHNAKSAPKRINRSAFGGVNTGFHYAQRQGDQVLVLYEGSGFPTAVLPIIADNETPPQLNEGECVIYGADGRVLSYVKNDGSTTIYQDPNGNKIVIDTNGNLTITMHEIQMSTIGSDPVFGLPLGGSGGFANGASVSATGTNQRGTLTVNTGTTGFGSIAFAKFFYAVRYDTASDPVVSITPADGPSTTLGVTIDPSSDYIGFTVNIAYTPLANTTYTFDFQVMG